MRSRSSFNVRLASTDRQGGTTIGPSFPHARHPVRRTPLALAAFVLALTSGGCARPASIVPTSASTSATAIVKNPGPPDHLGDAAEEASHRFLARALKRWRKGDRSGVVHDLRDLYALSRGDEEIGLALLETSVATRDRETFSWMVRLRHATGTEEGPVSDRLLRLVVRDEQARRPRLLSPDDAADLLVRSGERAYFGARFARAEELFTLALRIRPAHVRARDGLASTRERISRLNETETEPAGYTARDYLSVRSNARDRPTIGTTLR